MSELSDLYARYDGPLPRHETHITRPVCWEIMMRRHLRVIRIKRHEMTKNPSLRILAELQAYCDRLKQIRARLFQ